ncbi:SRPBCC domain-containing protein [Undibacterium fentianense]|uniref:SRPBCC domain-containing protein n=1 Tax=Undibacterium fentianense TaxID=2828728 RepID=A0A941E1T4_9BURK|nr:SRPBCC domain-containing protein [Undibacterium fentianense]MBR7799497.1 SRPBCC domain-containing protein [Undibacterium fentianense]
MRIQVSIKVPASIKTCWDTWINPTDVMQWNTASADWHTTRCENNLEVGGELKSRMEAKDGSMGFDFVGRYTHISQYALIEMELDDGRKVLVRFLEENGGTKIEEEFDPDDTYPIEMQRAGWQAILDNFAKHVLSK